MRYTSMLQAVVRALNLALDKELKSCIDERMALAIELWAMMYEDCAPWLSEKEGITSAGIPAAIAAELARLSTLELKTEVADKRVDVVYQRTIRGIRIPTEYGCALGGVLFKPYLAGADKKIVATQYIRGDRFFPLAFDGAGDIAECCLVEQVYSGRAMYTRLEYYSLPDKLVANFAYRHSNGMTAAGLGTRIALADVPQWGSMEETAVLTTDKLPFGYFRVPLANNIDPDSPLGVAVFSRAAGLIKEADRKYSNICWEYEAKQAAVHIATSLLKRNEAGTKWEYPGGKERLYRSVEYNVGAADKPLLDDFSPDIRATDLYMGYQEQLKAIEFACGLAYGTISDPQAVDKTATEVRSSKQRLYATVTDIQMALQAALEDYAAAVAWLIGAPVSVPTFAWDDSIMVDSEALARQKMLEFNAGLIDAVQYHMAVYGMTEKAALKFVEEMEARKPEPVVTDEFGGDNETGASGAAAGGAAGRAAENSGGGENDNA